MGVSQHLSILLRSLCNEQEAAVKNKLGEREQFRIRKGVRQKKCSFIFYPFNLYSKCVKRNEGLDQG